MTRKEWMLSLLLFFLLSPVLIGLGQTDEEELEWKVKVGDKKTYEIKKYIVDGKTESTSEMETEDGKHVNITYRKGLKFTIEITELDNIEDAYGKMKISGIILEKQPLSPYITPTTDNKTYWKEWVNETPEWVEEEEEDEEITYNRSVNGDIIIEEQRISSEDLSYETKLYRNWKTGWLVSLYYRIETSEVLLEEAGQSGLFTIPYDIPQPFIFLIVCFSAFFGGMGIAYLYERSTKG